MTGSDSDTSVTALHRLFTPELLVWWLDNADGLTVEYESGTLVITRVAEDGADDWTRSSASPVRSPRGSCASATRSFRPGRQDGEVASSQRTSAVMPASASQRSWSSTRSGRS